MMRAAIRGAAALLLPFLSWSRASAQAGPVAQSPDSIVALRIDPAEGETHLDGLLAEPFWSRARPISGFRQWEPVEGAPATERTEVRVAYDAETLYIGIEAFDTEPDRIVSRLRQRDRVMGRHGFGGVNFEGDDAVAIILDAFHDHRNAVLLATNPNGAEYDALITDEGSEVNADWRAVWRVASARTARGWSTEFAIPWRTLRYPAGVEGHVWGMNVTRVIQRKKEEVVWRSWQREGGGFARVSRAGHLVGLSGLPSHSLNVEAKPFMLTGRTQTRNDAGDLHGRGQFDAGLDLKSELHPGLVLDLTMNTDFAQVEVDDEQVNLTRFDLFFPEKRDFFLENAGIFEFGRQGFFGPPPYLMFFSRRIGIGPDGEIPIVGGARLTGRAGSQTLGLLSTVTDASEGRHSEIFNVARVKRDIGSSHYIGAMVTDRRGEGPSNTVAGVDGRFYLTPALILDSFASRSFTQGDGGDGLVYSASLDYTTDLFGFFIEHFTVDPDAVAGSGFITRKDVRQSSVNLRRRIRPAIAGLRLDDFRFSGEYQSTVDGRFQDWSAGLTSSTIWNSGDGANLSGSFGETRVDEAFPLADTLPVPPGRYSTNQWRAAFSSSSARSWTAGADVSGGQLFGGTIAAWGANASVAPDPSISIGTSFTRNHVELDSGSFTADITSLRGVWALSTKITTNALLQYNSLSDEVITNVRFDFIHRPGSDLYVVFTEGHDPLDGTRRVANRGLVIKLTYLMRF